MNLGVSYHYDANTKSDKVQVADGVMLDFTNTSSGLQSVIPLFVHLNYLNNTLKGTLSKSSVSSSKENELLSDYINKYFISRDGKPIKEEDVRGDKEAIAFKINEQWYSANGVDFEEIGNIYLRYILG